MNFLDAQCQSGPFVQERFGLCDNTSRPIAYADSESEENWIATVSNPERKAVIFTAIDKCVISDMEQPGRGRCDCMLTTEKQLYLVELKERNGSAWKNHASNSNPLFSFSGQHTARTTSIVSAPKKHLSVIGRKSHSSLLKRIENNISSELINSNWTYKRRYSSYESSSLEL